MSNAYLCRSLAIARRPGECSMKPLNLVFWSTPIGHLGSGSGGGVELTLVNVAQALMQRGHRITVVAAPGSAAGVQTMLNPDRVAQASQRGGALTVLEVAGTPPISAQHQGRETPVVIPSQSLLVAMGETVREMESQFDLILNFAYDWLPLYLTPFLHTPMLHLISMGSLSDVMDEAIDRVLHSHPRAIGVHTQAQAATFRRIPDLGDRCFVLSNGLDLSRYYFNAMPQEHLGWIGRLTPEKGLEDALAAVAQSQIPLKIWGSLENEQYWQGLQAQYPQAPVSYGGFLPTAQLQQQLGQCRGLLMTPRWVEAFGNVVIEALACGVPIVAYARGGPAEVVRSGQTGWLVEPDSVSGLVAAIGRLGEIDRHSCRTQAETEFSLEALADRYETWFQQVLTA
ncbi:MAG: glycosyltransferase family 4 protein [Prochlorothrix sp.]|nr:glycosyltransferase family 4 protein [Prochlorothrix sp.]